MNFLPKLPVCASLGVEFDKLPVAIPVGGPIYT